MERRRAFVSAEIARPLAILRYYVHRFLPLVYSRRAKAAILEYEIKSEGSPHGTG